jgi:hypothetical protein
MFASPPPGKPLFAWQRPAEVIVANAGAMKFRRERFSVGSGVVGDGFWIRAMGGAGAKAEAEDGESGCAHGVPVGHH